MSQHRHTASTITDADLDALYERLRKAERAANLLADAHHRAQGAEEGITEAVRQRKAAEDRACRAEAALDRVRTTAQRDDFQKVTHWTRGYSTCARAILAVLDEHKEQRG
ncbi:hypothetical protein [Streptomyces longispororuber]|uniref:hypothetical protein n=1 Tax=Streptomyces longispororuber TaxID=68230 RepID=UPI003702E6E4